MMYDMLFGETRKKRTPLTQSKKTKILLRCKGKCERCGKKLGSVKPNIHHKNCKPSDNRESNLIVLCPSCHSKRHGRYLNVRNHKPILTLFDYV